MSESPPPQPHSSNVLTYVVLALVGVGATGFLFLMFGELFVVLLVLVGLVGAVGALHYFVWGRALSEGTEKDTQRESDADAPPR